MSEVSTASPSITRLEQRLIRRMVARREAGLAEALCGLRGVTFDNRYRFESLYAVGGEGAVYLVRDLKHPGAPMRVGKVPLHPVHKPFEMTSEGVRERRRAMRAEAILLERNGSPFMPVPLGHFQFDSPLLDPSWGDVFAEAEPVLLMERLPGRDLDRWLARTHRSDLPPVLLRQTLNRVAVGLLQGVSDLYDRGYYYADLRPGNLRMQRLPRRHVRLLDAGGLVPVDDTSGRFPHVPAYLPPEVFHKIVAGKPVHLSIGILSHMAGRTLFEVATGSVPTPGAPVDVAALADSHTSPPVAEAIDALCRGDFVNPVQALRFLARRASRRVLGGNLPIRDASAIVAAEHERDDADSATTIREAVEADPVVNRAWFATQFDRGPTSRSAPEQLAGPATLGGPPTISGFTGEESRSPSEAECLRRFGGGIHEAEKASRPEPPPAPEQVPKPGQDPDEAEASGCWEPAEFLGAAATLRGRPVTESGRLAAKDVHASMALAAAAKPPPAPRRTAGVEMRRVSAPPRRAPVVLQPIELAPVPELDPGVLPPTPNPWWRRLLHRLLIR